MSNKITWVVALIFVCVLSIAGTHYYDQRAQLNQLLAKQSQVIVPPANNQPAPVIATPSIAKENPDLQQKKQDIRKAIIESLGNLEGMMTDMNRRIEALENGASIAQLENAGGNETEQWPDEEESDSSDTEYSAKAVAKQAAQQQYFSEIEQSIAQSSDEIFSQEIGASFDRFVNSREDWASAASVKTTECGSDACKVTLTYRNDMDPLAQFEFDSMAYMWSGELSNSTSRYRNNRDGTTDMTIYFAKRGSDLPARN